LEFLYPAAAAGKELQMKKIFLVKKDPKAVNSPENWNILNGLEFKRFLETDEGKARINNFARLNSLGSGDSMIIIECDLEEAKRNKRIHDLENARHKAERSLGIDTVSLESIPVGDELLRGEEILIDEECDVEKMVLRRIQIEEMLLALGMLNERDKALIEALYLKRTHTEKSYAEYLGIRQQTVHTHKVRVLQKLRELLDEE